MAWDTTMVQMLRVLINDLADTPTYSDTRLTQVITVAGQYVQHDVNLTTTYTIDVVNLTMSPDPTLTATLDLAFTNMCVMKSACIIDQGSARSAALSAGIKAVGGPVSLDTKDHMKGFETLLSQTACQNYEDMVTQWNAGRGIANICQFILGPYGDEYDYAYVVNNPHGSFYSKTS